MTHEAFDAANLNRLHDLAKAEAQRLRLQAMSDFGREAVDDFWRGADAIWQRGQATAQRSASRLQARLARRARSRRPTSSTVTTGA
jgi:hypothetical protein